MKYVFLLRLLGNIFGGRVKVDFFKVDTRF